MKGTKIRSILKLKVIIKINSPKKGYFRVKQKMVIVRQIL